MLKAASATGSRLPTSTRPARRSTASITAAADWPFRAARRHSSNKPITPVPFGFFGGFAGLDNMHPTIPGYAVIADVVLAALGRGSVQTDKAAAYAADTLLNNVRGLPLLIAEIELSLLGAFGVFRGSGTAPATV